MTERTGAGVPLLSLTGVCHDYDGQKSLDGVSFEVRRGEAVALLGPNGCGKSTALRVIAGLSRPSAGAVIFDGDVIDAGSLADRRFAKRYHQRCGLVFQDSDAQLFCPTVAEEIAFGPRQMGLSASEVDERVEDSLDLFGLRELAGRAPYRLSGGEKRKVAIACVTSMAPDLLMLDEPTASLDEDSAELVVGFLRSYVSAGHSVLATTHDQAFVEALRAREVRMEKTHRVVG